MAQPTDTPERFEVSEPSTALPVPALSRYARPASSAAREPVPDDATTERAEPPPAEASASASRAPVGEAAAATRPLDPIVQPASAEWATDPSPPQPVRDARTGDPVAGPSATAATHAPAIREERPRVHEDDKRRRPFWKRLSMGRPHAEPQAPQSAPIPKDLLKPAIERIDHLTRRFEREQKALHERLDEFEHNLTRLWELEEQMGMEEVRAQLAVMRANQEEIADALYALTKRVAVGATAVVASFAAVLIWLIL